MISNQLNEKQQLEYSKLKDYSEYLMNNNFDDIKTKLDHIRKLSNGYILSIDIILIINIKLV